ncbi:hypothetical protein [Burkholderia ubonensis]|uniref:hypothetical protein n=1 Tax=Burkholderia ubonensis TaxID=101571 RepID=UPI001056AF8D|nr:hypothetical protein [Burkholderia ubonensis]
MTVMQRHVLQAVRRPGGPAAPPLPGISIQTAPGARACAAMRTTRDDRTERVAPACLERGSAAPPGKRLKLPATISRCIAPVHAATPHAVFCRSVSRAATQRKQAARVAANRLSMPAERRADATLAAAPPPRSATPHASSERLRSDCRPTRHAPPEETT